MENCIIHILKKSIFDLQMQTCSHFYSDQRILSIRKPVVYKIKKPVSIVKRDESAVFDAFLQQDQCLISFVFSKHYIMIIIAGQHGIDINIRLCSLDVYV